jgi:hypothetical protein
MAIVEYTCNTCNRSTTIPQNKHGLEVFNRCIITADCKGTLVMKRVRSEYVRSSDSGTLPSWSSRKRLYTNIQPLRSSVWKVVHNLNNLPDVVVYIDDGSMSVNTTAFTVNYVNLNELHITFTQRYTGVAQCIAKYDNDVFIKELVETQTATIVSQHNTITFAVSEQIIDPVLHIKYAPISNTNNYSVENTVPLLVNNTSLAWGSNNVILVHGVRYRIFTMTLPNTNTFMYPSLPYTITIDTINDNVIKPKDMFIIYTEGSNNGVRVLDKVTDVSLLTTVSNFIINNNIAYINSAYIKSIYPAIILI